MKVELDKIGLVDLICGTDPDDAAGELPEARRFQTSSDGEVFEWDRASLRRLEQKDLYNLYKRIR